MQLFNKIFKMSYNYWLAVTASLAFTHSIAISLAHAQAIIFLARSHPRLQVQHCWSHHRRCASFYFCFHNSDDDRPLILIRTCLSSLLMAKWRSRLISDTDPVRDWECSKMCTVDCNMLKTASAAGSTLQTPLAELTCAPRTLWLAGEVTFPKPLQGEWKERIGRD